MKAASSCETTTSIGFRIGGESPDRFDPHRFSDEVAEHKKHNFMWIPFGGGAHKCIGMHFARMMFLLTFREVMSDYRIEYAKKNYFPAKLQHFPFNRPLDNLPIRLVPHG